MTDCKGPHTQCGWLTCPGLLGTFPVSKLKALPPRNFSQCQVNWIVGHFMCRQIFGVMKLFFMVAGWYIHDSMHLSKPIHSELYLMYANLKNQPRCNGVTEWNTDCDKLM